ncbi:hypothetical protein [Alkalitalea saponilacus]|uniref:Uncharacterized protein n=1 Tax=Alkalitalea saponilacus TaxID=889453 RepID=A0A1T5HIJ2_9BACT|nr:hypothetical protein [Alkalitalea saponilacus]ASB48173.1 hypothetical protein CDL62_02940 [Alkalitalea saponilacus]SKC20493.1 hypothetical protein SAMN03080601_02352 [Alkalitalea saponilacus]
MKNKKVLFFGANLFFALILLNCSGSKEPHIGEWKSASSSGELNYLILNKDNKAILSMDGMRMGGDNYTLVDTGIEIKMEITYEIDYEKDPIWIDFSMYPVDVKFSEGSESLTSEQKQLVKEMILSEKERNPSMDKGIIRFLSHNQMEFQGSEGGWENPLASRPTEFNSESSVYVLFSKEK